MTIVEFLEARIAEDEAVARTEVDIIAATFGKVPGEFKIHYGWARHTVHVENGARGSSFASGAPEPARVLREVAAKRAIMAEHGIDQDPCDAHDAMYESVPCDVILNLAAIYLDHPDYQSEWAIP